MTDLWDLKAVSTCWPKWRGKILAITGATPNASSVLRLGEHLNDVFASTARAGRRQRSLSGGGSGWEALVCWYLNLCLVGTTTVVVKKKSFVPTAIRQALTVTYGNNKTNSESDLIAVTFPRTPVYQRALARKSELLSALGDQAERDIGNVEVCVIQCKTNWNENAQIPMLWDIIYAATGFSSSVISLGENGNAIQTLKKFSYAFVTMPSNKNVKFSPTTMPVIRVKSLSGGNYWGRKSVSGVALSVNEMLNKNFYSSVIAARPSFPLHLTAELAKLRSSYKYFRI